MRASLHSTHGQRENALRLQRMRRHHPKWLGKCPSCGAWNTLIDKSALAGGPPTTASARSSRRWRDSAELATLSEIEAPDIARTPTGIGELDRVLGGGLVDGGVVLIGGDPGIGKSTLLLQALDALQRAGRKALYVTGEESGAQVALRSRRLGLDALAGAACWPRSSSRRSSPTLDAEQPGDRGDRLDPDALLRRAHLRARLGGAGARVRGAAHALRQGERHRDRARRPRHQGRRARRPARARAHGRHGALLRGRHALELPPGARVQEPLRRGERDRRVRDDREGPARASPTRPRSSCRSTASRCRARA